MKSTVYYTEKHGVENDGALLTEKHVFRNNVYRESI